VVYLIAAIMTIVHEVQNPNEGLVGDVLRIVNYLLAVLAHVLAHAMPGTHP
jgi:hypothetical protein